MCVTILSTEQLKYRNFTVNLGQSWIFYKVNQIRLTWTKLDPDDLTWFQLCHEGTVRILTVYFP